MHPPGALALLVLELDDGDALAVVGPEALVRDVARHGAGDLAACGRPARRIRPASRASGGSGNGDDHGELRRYLACEVDPMHIVAASAGRASRSEAQRSERWRPLNVRTGSHGSDERRARHACCFSFFGIASMLRHPIPRRAEPVLPLRRELVALLSGCRPAPCRTPAGLRPARSNRSASRTGRRTPARADCRCRPWSSRSWSAVPFILNRLPGIGTETRNAEPVPVWQSVQWQIVDLLRIGLAFDGDRAAMARAGDFHRHSSVIPPLVRCSYMSSSDNPK